MIEERGSSQSTLMYGLEALLSLFSVSNTDVHGCVAAVAGDTVIGCAAYETVESLCSS